MCQKRFLLRDWIFEGGVSEERCTDGLGFSHRERCCKYKKKCFKGGGKFIYTFSWAFLGAYAIYLSLLYYFL